MEISVSNMASPVANYHILSSIVHTFFKENKHQIFTAHYTQKVHEKFFHMPKIVVKLNCALDLYAHYKQ
jgi:hypothetical protein